MQPWKGLAAGEFGWIDCTNVQEYGLCAGASILREVLGTHLRWHLSDTVGTQIATQHFCYVSGEGRIVVHGVGPANDLDRGHGRRVRGRCFGIELTFDCSEEMLAYLGIERTDCHKHLHLIGNNVRHGASVNGTDGNHGRSHWVRLAGHNGLDPEHGARGYDNGINSSLRVGSMATSAEDCDFNRVRRGAEESGVKADLPGWQGRLIVYADNNVRFRKPYK